MMLWAALGVLCLSVLSGAFWRGGWPFEIFTSLLPQLAAILLLFAVCTLMLGRPGTAALAACVAAIALLGAREVFERADEPLSRHDVRVVWANLLGERDAFRRAIQFAAANNADIVAFAEFPSDLSDADQLAVAGSFSHRVIMADSDGIVVTAFSRTPVSDVEPVGISWRRDRQGVSFRVNTSAGPLEIVAFHPSVPILPRMQRSRDETAAVAFARTRNAGVSALLVGDFNTVTWSPLIRKAIADGRLRRAHIGVHSTWMSPWPVLGPPIDHAFAANGAKICARVGPGIGSDHLPLLIDVQLGR